MANAILRISALHTAYSLSVFLYIAADFSHVVGILATVLKLFDKMPVMEELTYLDLVVLRKIDKDSTVEKFGTSINTSFFEAANMLGTMKVKGLLNIETSVGGQSPLSITGEGRDMLEQASRKAAEPIDMLDEAILHSLAGGVRDLDTLQAAINIRPMDVAFHLHKLQINDYIGYDVRSGKISLSLTEKGFNTTGGVRAVKVPPPEASQTGVSGQSASQAAEQAGAAGGSGQIAVKKPFSFTLPWVKQPQAGAQAQAGKSQGPPWVQQTLGQNKATPSDIAEILDAAGMPPKTQPQSKSPQSQASPGSQAQQPQAQSPQTQASPRPQAQSQSPQSQAQPGASASTQSAGSGPQIRQGAGISPKPERAEDKMPLGVVRLSSKLDYYLSNYLGYLILLAALLLFVAYSILKASMP